MSRVAATFAFVLALSAPAARAQDATLSEAQKAQLESLRAEVAQQIQLQAYDLLDELVYAWVQKPVFATATPVVLADVSVPVGFGSGMRALIENHFAELVTKNPRGNVTLAHCPSCTQLVVHSGAKGTVISRGVDQPEALVKVGNGSGSKHALFLDFEAEGSSLVLRARITALDPALPILYAKTLSTSTSTAALLRTPEQLKSAAEAREEYLEALQGRGLFLLPVRVAVRSYAENDSPESVRPFPFIWVQVGAEAALTRARAWTGSLSIGASWTPELQNAFMAQARFSRLLSGSAVSLTRPDLYGFVGASVISVQGPGALAFGTEIPTTQQMLNAATGVQKPQEIFASFQVGVEMRIKNRIGAGFYLETSPALTDARSIGNHLDFGFIQFQSFGAEVSFCF